MILRQRGALAFFVPAALAVGTLCLPCNAVGQRLSAPAAALMDEVVSIRAIGLRPGQRAILETAMADSGGRTWRARGEFAADARGEIWLARDASLGGAYTGVDPMGLVTAMDLPGQPGVARYVPPGLREVPLRVALLVDGRVLDSVTVVRRLLAPGIRVVPVREPRGPVGTLFLPDERGRTPGVLVLGGSEGGHSALDVAALLASHGYAALSLAYFGVDPLPPQLSEIPLEYFDRALTFLGAQPQVDSLALALFGTSKGAEAALLVGADNARVRAVVAYAPSSVAWSCICSEPERASWSHRGRGIPSVPPGRDPAFSPVAGQALRPAVHYRYRLRSLPAVPDAAIPVERIHGPVMLVAGEADELWPSGEMARQLRARLATAQRPFRDTVLIYPEAGHLIGTSYLPSGSTRVAGGRIETGGTSRANALAQADAWPRVLQFLAAALRD